MHTHANTPQSTVLCAEALAKADLSPKAQTLSAPRATLDVALPAPGSTRDLPAVIDPQPVPAINHQPSPGSSAQRRRRTGRIACLPKLQRDLVNRMLSNGVPYKNIVLALDELGFNVTERNISNWATGGYLEWQLEQDLVLQNRLDQDHLLDHLRRDDAPELREVSLQAAATR